MMLRSKAEQMIASELQALADAWKVKLAPERMAVYVTVLRQHNSEDVCAAIRLLRDRCTGMARMALPHVFIIVQRTKDAYMKRIAQQHMSCDTHVEAA